MRLSELQLEDLHVERLVVEACPDAPPETRGGRLALDVVHLAQSNESSDKWKVTIRIRVEAEEERQPPYSIDVRLTGFFRYVDQSGADPISEAGQIVLFNGTSVLFSAAREHIWLATSRGPWGGFSLPTVDLRGLAVDVLEDDPES